MKKINVKVYNPKSNANKNIITTKHFEDNNFIFYNNNYNKKIYNDSLTEYEKKKIDYSQSFDNDSDDSPNVDFDSTNDYEMNYDIEDIGKSKNDNDDVLHYADGTAITDFEDQPIKNNSNFSEDEIDIYDLDDEEKAEVYQKNYNPWDFEEEEMDEESYYCEDDLK